MLLGLFIIFKPRRKYRSWKRHHEQWHHNYYEKKKHMSSEDYLDVNAVFGSAQRNIISKNFKGGEVNSVFGGIEINLSQADFEEKVTLEMNQVFGGAKLIVPSHWEIRSQINAVFGGIEDKRQSPPNPGSGSNKVLVLNGSCVFGGIEIRSF
jgi:predicted membrane protein